MVESGSTAVAAAALLARRMRSRSSASCSEHINEDDIGKVSNESSDDCPTAAATLEASVAVVSLRRTWSCMRPCSAKKLNIRVYAGSKRRSSLQTPLSAVDEESTTASVTVSSKNAAARVAPKLSLSCDAIRTAVKSLYNLDDFWLHKIGEGFFSEVFKVVHKASGRVLVLKMNKHRSNSNSMLREMQLMNRLRHPNILRYEAACVHEGQLHALTEFVNGGSLDQLIKTGDRRVLTWPTKISLALDTLSGLSYLHEKGYIHRDLTSKNILVRKDGAGRLSGILADFGLSARVPRNGEVLSQVGTPFWMAPECLAGKYYDQKADIFSYGIVLCELIALVEADPDCLPRTGCFGVDYLAFSNLLVDPECPPEFLRVAFACCQIDPEARLSAFGGDMRADMESLLREVRLYPDRRRKKTSATSIFSTKASSLSPSDKARLHQASPRTPSPVARRRKKANGDAVTVCREMSRLDPHYDKHVGPVNPFESMLRSTEDYYKILDSGELFLSCFENSASRTMTSPFPKSPTEEKQEALVATDAEAVKVRRSDSARLEQRRVRKTTSLVNTDSEAAHISDEVVRKLQLADFGFEKRNYQEPFRT